MKNQVFIFCVITLFSCVVLGIRPQNDNPFHKFSSNPGLGPDNVTQHSGYITVNGTYNNGAHLFYWMFESRSSPKTDPIILWLTGGPGCSSELALFYENGPYTLNNNLTLNLNPYSWNSFANLIYVDQPVGTGFSYADSPLDYVVDEKQVAQDMFVFLQNFMQMYPQYSKLPFYILGESYAGHYVPAISYRIQKGNHNKEGLQLNLKGLAIGNGWVDPYEQYPAYVEFAYSNNLINYAEYLADKALIATCLASLDTGVWPVAFLDCQLIVEGVLGEMGVTLGYFPNPYDYKIPCAYPPLCYNFDNLDEFLAQPSVQKALGVSSESSWTECNQIVHTLMLGDWVTNLEILVPSLLQEYTVLVYSGELDYICNWMGGDAWTSNMKWPGKTAFNTANRTDWHVGGQVVGSAKSAQGLTFLKVSNAGHMVPMDQPKNALDMLKRFLKNQPFN